MLYTVSGHALLSEQVLALPEPKRDAYQTLAESLLELGSPVYTVPFDVERVTLAVVRQMNFLVAQGIDPYITESTSSGHSSQSVVWRDRWIDPVAALLIAQVMAQYDAKSESWPVLTSLRTRGEDRIYNLSDPAWLRDVH
jgi:hypothetical protein